ncbi:MULTISPECIES: pectinesterase family protein [unclassified Paenibacillus]|uniref:pectinesterase family protein n=1 Tax=unclassified Paenibacillus TaxID=185978 RepID=UPI0030CBA57E
MKRIKSVLIALCALLLIPIVPEIAFAGETNTAYAAANINDSLSANIYSPTDLRMAPASNTDTTVVLAWEKPLFYSNITKYNIYDSDGTRVGSTDKTYYKFLGLTPERTYTYTVRAQDTSGNESLDSNTVQITTKKTGIRFNVKDYGASGDGNTLDTVAIQTAIDAVTPGDTLYFPPGKYVTGGLFLHSNMTVFVDAGAQVMPSSHKADFLPFVTARHSIEEPEAYQSLFNAGVMDHDKYDDYSVTDITFLGPGTIGDEESGLKLREEYDNDKVEVGTTYGGGHLLSFNNAHNVYIDGLKIRNGMMWTVVPVYSKDITAYNLDINTTQHNGDGFNPNSSESVYILNSTFQTGDDGSAIKSGINQEGRDIGRPSRFIYYRGDTFSGGHGGVVIGSEMSGGISDIYVEDCNLIPLDVKSNTVAPGFKIKTSTSRGGYIRNIQVRDSLINKIDLNSNYDKLPVPDIYPPDMSNFRFTNLRNNDISGTDNIISLTGAASTSTADNALKNLQFINCAFAKAQLAYTENIFFTNSSLPKGISATNSANIVQDGVVVTDKAFPVHEDFTEYKTGDTPGGYWSASSYAPGLITIAADGDLNPNSIFLNDQDSGYVSASRGFGSQTGTLSAEVHMKFPAPPNLTNGVPNGTYANKPTSNNRVFQLLGSNGKVAVWLNTENSGALSYVINGKTSPIIIPAIPLDKWFTVKTVVDFPNKLVDVYYNGTKVLSKQPFYDSTLAMADISTFKSIGPNNNTTVASQVYLDNLYISASEEATSGYGIQLTHSGSTNSISDKGGRLTFSATKTTGETSQVTWAVYNSDLTPTDVATIDDNGVLTANSNGKVIVAATMNDGTAIIGLMPITITGQETVVGYKSLQVTTALGTKPNLPNQMPILREDGAVSYAPVIWDLVPASEYQQIGAFTLQGTVTGYSARAEIQVEVVSAGMTGYRPVIATTAKGIAPSLPDHVTAIFNDQMTKSLPVSWEPISPDLYADTNIDGFKVMGTVQGSDLPVTAHVYVLSDIAPDAKVIVVAADGSGDYKSIQAAVDAVPDQNRNRIIIFVKNGLYYEKVLIPDTKPYISLMGESKDGTILTYDDNPKKTAPDGTSLGLGTYTDYTLMIKGHDFYAKDLTVINSSGSGAGQSVAVDVYADKAFFENCNIIGYQDTLLTRNLTDNADPNNYANNAIIQSYRSYFKDCFISGSVDFIFGPGIAVFDNSEIHSRLAGHVTAASTPEGQEYGYVFLNSKVTGEALLSSISAVDLGRPWRPYAKTVYLNSYMGDHIAPSGWNNFGNSKNEATAYYGEYQSFGPGANPQARMNWTHQLTDTEAEAYTLHSIFSATSAINGREDWDPTQLASDNPIESLLPVHVETPVGVAPILPTVVGAVYADETVKQVPVVWEAINPELYAVEGRFTVTGAVYGTELKAEAKVTVRSGSFLTGPGSVEKGQSFEVVYGMSRVTSDVYGLDLTLNYDPEQIQFLAAESLLDGIRVIDSFDNEGQTRILMASTTPGVGMSGDLPRILQLHFTAKDVTEATVASLEATRIIMSDGEGNESSVEGTAYQVNITVTDTGSGDVIRTALQSILHEAASTLASASMGTLWGQYSQSAIAIFKDAIANATVVLNDSDATQEEVNLAAQDLSTALQKLATVMNLEAGMDDLLLLSSKYGITSSDNGWSEVSRYDLNKDQQIDIVDLAGMARKITSN